MTPPSDVEDAHILMCCHQQSVDDFQLQIDMVDIELSMLCEDNLPYQTTKVDELEERKLKLLSGKRFHQNARHAYWYVTARGDKDN